MVLPWMLWVGVMLGQAPDVPPAPPPPAGPACVLKQDKTFLREAFTDVKRVGARLLVASADGTLRWAETPALPVAHDAREPLLGLAVSADASAVAAVGYDVLVRSSDGGRSFHAERTPAEGIVYAAAFAGEHLLLFDGKGRGWRMRPEERAEELRLPRRVTFFGATFVDARRGYVVGECGTLLETLDGGTSWTVLAPPTPESLQGVLAWGDTLYVSGGGGVWRSEDRGRTFQRAVSAPMCVRLAREGQAVAAACGGGTGNVLRYAAEGRDFQPVPVPYSHALLSVELLPGGDIVAVGGREQFIRARASGGALTYDSKSLPPWKTFIDSLEPANPGP